MPVIRKLEGQKFGNLLVESKNNDIKSNNSMWNCVCECGNRIVVSSHFLTSGKKTCCKECNIPYKSKELLGKKFGRITVLKSIGKENKKVKWLCKCDCGNECTAFTTDLKSGKKKSCGCLKKERTIEASKTHGLSKERIHKEWRGILHRCKNPSASHYENYGGRGITVCDEWKEDFMAFYEWSMQNGYADNLTLDRKDNDKGYSPDNCRWVTHMENCHNRGVRKDSSTGCAGVTIRELASGKIWYRVHITTDYKRVYVGKYESLDEAIKARKEAEKKYWGKKEGGLNE